MPPVVKQLVSATLIGLKHGKRRLMDANVASAPTIDAALLAARSFDDAAQRTITADRRIGTVVNCRKWVDVAPQNPSLQHVAGLGVRRSTLKACGNDDDWLAIDLAFAFVHDDTLGTLGARTLSA
jgi:hypothetical protein